MHRIDADAHVGNRFSNGDPATGTPGTRTDDTWLNAVQEEIAGTVEGFGGVLAKGTNTQLRDAVLPRAAKAWGVFHKRSSDEPTRTAGFNFASVTTNGGLFRVTFTTPMPSANYAPVPTVMSAIAAPLTAHVGVVTAGYFDIAIYNGSTPVDSGGPGNEFDVSFHVFG